MNFIGVDLAWGPKNDTGLCLVRGGAAIESCLVRTDEEILAWLRPLTIGPCLVAIDAPLVVTNPSGRRRCESLISRVFNKSQAGAHSSNLSLSAFSNGVRAMRLAKALDLGYDPGIEPGLPVRRAVEVYPHPALIALFDLDLSLKYKQKRGRTPTSRKAAFAQLFERLESLKAGEPALDLSGQPRWSRLREEVEASASNAALDRCEDEIDAYVCAYVALHYWTHGLARCRVVGDLAGGYIITPVTEEIANQLDRAALTPLSSKVRARDKPPRTQWHSVPPAADPVAIHALTPPPVVPGYCGCGCGARVRARYLPGHDARHKSDLIRATRAGHVGAEAELIRLGWGRFIGAFGKGP